MSRRKIGDVGAEIALPSITKHETGLSRQRNPVEKTASRNLCTFCTNVPYFPPLVSPYGCSDSFMKQNGSRSSKTFRPKLWAIARQPPQTGRMGQDWHALQPER